MSELIALENVKAIDVFTKDGIDPLLEAIAKKEIPNVVINY